MTGQQSRVETERAVYRGVINVDQLRVQSGVPVMGKVPVAAEDEFPGSAVIAEHV